MIFIKELDKKLNGKLIKLPILFMEYWALLGCLVLGSVVVMSSISSLTGFIIAKPFPGDFELTEMGIAIAAFMFLPYCQLTFAHVSADIFTAKASISTVNFLSRCGSFLALCFACLLVWRMYEGMLDYQEYLETTTILQIPLWYAFVPAVVSLVLWAISSVITLIFPEKIENSLIGQVLTEH
jgi:TRAP-type C4-dicarboxylate transport system permease small subunit